jgi:hypothetical protein
MFITFLIPEKYSQVAFPGEFYQMLTEELT